MKLKAYLGLFIFLFIFVSSFYRNGELQAIDAEFTDQIDTALLNSSFAEQQNIIQNGYIKVPGQSGHFDQQQLQDIMSKHDDRDYTYSWTWGSKDKTATIASSLGLDDKHHFVNSYLIGYMPFYTEKNWVPLYILASRKKYQYDHLQYTGLTDIWQNSEQAFRQTRGDCEDHAIALADWLISLGVDARVALGKYKDEGHAWVVVFEEGKEYLLEATSKQKQTRWSQYRLAATQTDYRPRHLFNRDHFWVNTGSEYTVSYSGENWKQTSTFYRDRQPI